MATKTLVPPDIVEFFHKHFAGELEEQPGTRPYWKMRCPLHDDSNPSFLIYPKIQRCICYSCSPSYMTVADFYAKWKGIRLDEAQEVCYIEEDFESVATRVHLKKSKEFLDRDLDQRIILSTRVRDLYSKLPFGVAHKIHEELRGMEPLEASGILSKYAC